MKHLLVEEGEMESETITKHMPITLFSNIALVRDAYLDGNLELPLTPASLRHLGMKDWHVHPTKRSLADLLWFSDGYPTDAFTRMAEAFRTNHDEYQSILKTLLKEGIYAEPTARIADAHIDLTKPSVSASQIEGFFKGYNPPNGYKDMAYLYLSFCREAGLAPPLENRPRTTSGRITPKGETYRELGEEKRLAEAYQSNSHGRSNTHPDLNVPLIERQRDFVQQLLRDLPIEDVWTEEDRRLWMDSVRNNVDLLLKRFERKEKEQEK
jgi:hypothetical protein